MDIQGAPTWALTAAAAFACIAFLALVALLAMLVLWWRGRPRTWAVTPDAPPAEWSGEEAVAPPAPGSSGPMPEGDEPASLASAVRSLIVEAVLDGAVTGRRDLVLSPPPHPRQMTWHIHLAARVALDLVDGRSVTTSPPKPSHTWALPSGARAGLAMGDPTPSPGQETRAVRVDGRYLTVRYMAGSPGAFEVLVAAVGEPGHRMTVDASDLARVGTTIREGMRAAQDSPATAATAMGYSPPSWRAHERLWIEIGG